MNFYLSNFHFFMELLFLLLQFMQLFGADMKVSLLNDGPVTIIMDTKNKE